MPKLPDTKEVIIRFCIINGYISLLNNILVTLLLLTTIFITYSKIYIHY